MKTLSSDFTYKKYGVDVRLVDVNDAEFILSLRTDPVLNKHLHSVDNDLEKQIDWIREYKKREAIGLEYYFIYSYNGKQYGLNRLYHIDIENKSCTSGSWICKPGTNVFCSMVTQIIINEIKYEVLEFDVDSYEVRKDNHYVLNFHKKMLKAEIIGETELDILFRITKETYQVGNEKLKHLLQISE